MFAPKIKYGLEVKFGTTYGQEEIDAVAACMRNNAPSCGQKVHEFEVAFAEHCGAAYALAVTSATTGLTLAGVAAGVEPGDEVITTPISWIATSTAFSVLGAKIVFCDVDPETLLLDPDKLEALITPKTKAIVPVHLYGRCCDLDRILEIAHRHNVVVIDDCAHNPGGSYHGKGIGSIADMSVFSFQQQKNMSTLGEGGMVTTNSRELFDRVLSYRSLCARVYGKSDKYLSIDEEQNPMGKRYWWLTFDDVGYNFRMVDAQAAAGLVQLKKLDANNARRIALAKRLTEKLSDCANLILPKPAVDSVCTWHIYMVMLTPDSPISKEDFMYELYNTYGIKAWSHYLPIHIQKPYIERGHTADECPVAMEAFERYVTLPIQPMLTEEAIDYMADSIKALLGTK
ncbi:DegT/DnrJ/EryC1/StrS family aminotransferase [Anaerotruncus rubiinfantis]|uniref:DegT/DnrJ/EryC1/StrS family aminotransferase n=1 Tax=Anaerotruncus rubiinfantis TaxID=1720200 RepID=UPI00189923EF|nr:DegT/DnrJ/EryC1/StrS family aminotransferase [Anaerotruncus rubiinfantis]